MNAGKRLLGIAFAVAVVGLLLACPVLMIVGGDPVREAEFRLKHEVADERTRIFGEVETGRRLKNVEVSLFYTRADGDTKTIILRLGTLEAGVNAVETFLSVPHADFNDPQIGNTNSSSMSGLAVAGLGCLGGGVFLILGAILLSVVGPKIWDAYWDRKIRRSRSGSDRRWARIDAELEELRQLAGKKTGEKRRVSAASKPPSAEQAETYNHTAAATVLAFNADEIFLQDPSFYDRIRGKLEKTGAYPIEADARTNDFLFCCELSKAYASWEDVLREVCRFCYGDLDADQQAAADSGDLRRMVDTARDVYEANDESVLPLFYAMYPKLPKAHFPQGFLPSWERFRAYVNGSQPLPETESGQNAASLSAIGSRPERGQEAKAFGSPADKAARLIERDPVTVGALFLEFDAVREIERTLWETGAFPVRYRILTELEPDDWDAFFAGARKLMADRFLQRLDKKTAKAFDKAEIDEKAALFRDLPGADRPEIEEGFFYSVFDALGGDDLTAKRGRFDRLIAGRFG